MRLGLVKTVGFLTVCGIVAGASGVSAKAEGLNSGVSVAMSSYMNLSEVAVKAVTEAATTAAGQTEDTTICGYTNLGIAQVESNLNVRTAADENSELVGKMQNDAGCEILGQEGDWYQIQSGKVTGYVKAEYLLTGDAARAHAQEVMKTIATVTAEGLHLRADMSTESEVLALMPTGEELVVLEDNGSEWIKVDLDGEQGYAHRDYVELSTQLPKAQTMTEIKAGEGYSDVRVACVSYATQFVGNPYVWGGTSLTNGADCSGFTMSVMAKYGVYLPHSSRAQANCGTRVSASEAQPGDLFFYGSGKGINHVAIYIGNGQIVHASSPSTGIKISNAFYRSPICVTRVLGN